MSSIVGLKKKKQWNLRKKNVFKILGWILYMHHFGMLFAVTN